MSAETPSRPRRSTRTPKPVASGPPVGRKQRKKPHAAEEEDMWGDSQAATAPSEPLAEPEELEGDFASPAVPKRFQWFAPPNAKGGNQSDAAAALFGWHDDLVTTRVRNAKNLPFGESLKIKREDLGLSPPRAHIAWKPAQHPGHSPVAVPKLTTDHQADSSEMKRPTKRRREASPPSGPPHKATSNLWWPLKALGWSFKKSPPKIPQAAISPIEAKSSPINSILPAFAHLTNFASSSLEARVIFVSDETFGMADCILESQDPKPPANEWQLASHMGSPLDGDRWKTRRRTQPGHDWVLVQLAAPCTIRGICVDVSAAIGPPPFISIEGAFLPDLEKDLQARFKCLKPPIHRTRGPTITSSAVREAEALLESHSIENRQQWGDVLAMSKVETSNCRNYFEIDTGGRECTHIRLNLFPDGCISRLRVYGEVSMSVPLALSNSGTMMDLVSARVGGQVLHCSDQSEGNARSLILSSKPKGAEDCWITCRKPFRPPIFFEGEDHLIANCHGEDWVIISFALRGHIEEAEIDAAACTGLVPESLQIELCDLPEVLSKSAISQREHFQATRDIPWQTLVPRRPVDARGCKISKAQMRDVGAGTHARLRIFPDGAVGRLRLHGIGWGESTTVPE